VDIALERGYKDIVEILKKWKVVQRQLHTQAQVPAGNLLRNTSIHPTERPGTFLKNNRRASPLPHRLSVRTHPNLKCLIRSMENDEGKSCGQTVSTEKVSLPLLAVDEGMCDLSG
jgi:hypothetical protein